MPKNSLRKDTHPLGRTIALELGKHPDMRFYVDRSEWLRGIYTINAGVDSRHDGTSHWLSLHLDASNPKDPRMALEDKLQGWRGLGKRPRTVFYKASYATMCDLRDAIAHFPEFCREQIMGMNSEESCGVDWYAAEHNMFYDKVVTNEVELKRSRKLKLADKLGRYGQKTISWVGGVLKECVTTIKGVTGLVKAIFNIGL